MKCSLCGEPLDTAGVCGGFRGLVHTHQQSLAHGSPEYSDSWTGPGVRFEDLISATDLAENRSTDMTPMPGGFSIPGNSLPTEEKSSDSGTGEFPRSMGMQESISSQPQEEFPAGGPQEEISSDGPQEELPASSPQEEFSAGSPQEELPAGSPQDWIPAGGQQEEIPAGGQQEQSPAGSPQDDPGNKRRILFPLKAPIAAACFCIAAAAVIALVFFPGLFVRPKQETETPDSHIADHENPSAGRAENSSIRDNNEENKSPSHLPPTPSGNTASEAYTAEAIVQAGKTGTGATGETAQAGKTGTGATGEMAQADQAGTEASKDNSHTASTAKAGSETAGKTAQADKTGKKEAKDKKDTGSAAETGTDKSPQAGTPADSSPENVPAKEKADGSSVYVRRIYTGTENEQESLKDFLKENNLSEEVQEERNSGQSISIETLSGSRNSSAMRRIEEVKYRSASGDEAEDGTVQKRTSLKYDYLTNEYGAPSQLEKKTVTEKEGGKKRKLVITYRYENAGWGQTLIVEETYSSKDPKFKAEGFGNHKKTRYTYEYNYYYNEYNLVRKEYLENDEPAPGPGGVLAVEYSGYEKSMEADNEYCITETYVSLPDGTAESEKGSIRIGQSSFDEVRYYYDGSTYRLKKLRYFKKGQKVKGPQGFHSMECITADSLCSRIENYYDPRNNPIAIHGDEIFQSWQDLYLLNESEFKILFFRKDIQE